jgi:putative peptidoglycan lipid II flippase
MVSTIALFCIILGIAFNKQIVNIMAPGFEGETYTLTLGFLKIYMWSVVVTSLIQVLISYLNCNNKFIQSSISTLALSSIQMIVIFISGITNENILIFGILLSNIVQFFILYSFSNRNGLKYRFLIEKTPELKKAFIIAGPIFIGSMIMQINTFVDKVFASQLVEGSIAALNYSAIIRGFIFYVFSIAITTMIYPILSQYISEHNFNKVKEIFSKGINIIIVLFVPITIGSIILSEPAITFVYERGEFGHDSTIMTTSAFIMYSIGLLSLAIRDVITKVFYSMQDTKSTMYIGAMTVFLNIILNILLIKPLAHTGLALATSLSEIITLPLFFIILRQKIGGIGLKNTSTLFIKSCMASLVMGAVVYFCYNYVSPLLGSSNIMLLVSIAIAAFIGGMIYFVLMLAMKVKEMDFFTGLVKDMVGRIKRK